jgi:hypothetical protein
MPFNNNYNRSIARDIDFLNRNYITHCDSTGQGTINYRSQMNSGFIGSGKASKIFCNKNDSDSEEEYVGKGGAILGFEAGTILGGPRDRAQLQSKKEISTYSSLGAPIKISTAAIADAEEDAEQVNKPPPPPVEGEKTGGAILGMHKPYFPATSEVNRRAPLTSAIRPHIGSMMRAGRKVSVRDLGDYDSESSYETSDDEAVEKGRLLLASMDVVQPVAIIKKEGGKKPKGLNLIEEAKKKLDEHYRDMKVSGNGISHKRHREDSEEEELEGGFAAALAKGAQVAGRAAARIASSAAKAAARAAKAAAKAAARKSASLARAAAKRAKSIANRAKNAKKAKNAKNAKLTKAPKNSKNLKGKKSKTMDRLDKLGNLAQGVSSVIKATQGGPGGEDGGEGDNSGYMNEDEEEEEEDEEEAEDEGENDVKEAEDEVKRKQAKEREQKTINKAKEGEAKGKQELEKLKKDVAEAKEGNDNPEGPKWQKDKKVIEKENKKPVGNVLGYTMYSKTPVEDWDEFYNDEFGDFSESTIEQLITTLKMQAMDPEDIQQLLSQSQGAIKAKESKGVSSSITGAKIEPRTDVGNVNKNTTCMDAYNNVADASATAPKEARPVRKNDTYFGGYFKTTQKASRGVQEVMKEKAQMNASSLSGMGKTPKKGRKTKKEKLIESEMKSSSMSGMGKKPNARAEIVKQVMKEKGMKMIEASKYVKANNLYKK